MKDPQIGWAISPGLTPYPEAAAFMEHRAEAIADDAAGELVWLVEHPPLYTAGVSAKAADLLAPDRFPVHRTGRGGQYTYHGPGQRVMYVMLDLRRRGRDVRAFVEGLEQTVIQALERFGVQGLIRPGRVGVWVERRSPVGVREDKIAAIGVRVRRWATFHGLALNVDPDLTHFAGIVPCGISAHGVTSLVDLGRPASMHAVDESLRQAFEQVFGPTAETEPPDFRHVVSASFADG